MNRKQFITLLVFVALIGVAGLIVHRRNNRSWQSSGPDIGQKLLPNLPVNDVTQIIIKAGTNELNLARRDNLWRVRERENYPANFSEISSLVQKFADLKVVQSQDVGPSQLGRFELLPPGPGTNTATQIEFKSEAGKSLGSVLLGKKHMAKGNSQFEGMGGWPDGRYVMAGTGLKSLAVISDPLENVQPAPEAWLNKNFLNIEKPRSITVQFPEATNSWKLTRASETNDWLLADEKPGEKLDSSKISSVTTPLSSPSFNDVLPGDANLGAAGLTNVTTLTVGTFDGFTYVATIGVKESEIYPVKFSISATLPTERLAVSGEKLEDKTRLDKEFKDREKSLNEKLAKEKSLEHWIYRMPAYTLDSTLKPRSELLVEAKPETPAKAAEK